MSERIFNIENIHKRHHDPTCLTERGTQRKQRLAEIKKNMLKLKGILRRKYEP